MKTRIISFLSAAALLAGCYEDAGELGVDTATRIALSPAEIGFTADGTTVDGKVAYVGVVQVMPFEKGRYTWRAEGDVAWATVGETVVDESFADTWTGAVTTTRMRAVEIMATPNTEYRRSGVLTVTAEDGTVETFPITQAGLKADAEIVCELAETGIEYASAGGQTTIDYTTNMGDVYDYSVTYGEPDAGEWLTWSDEGAGRVVLRAAEWTSKSDNRTAVFTIHVGTADTSEASAEIAVVQLRVDDYYYLYGASVPRYEAIDAALQMTKQEEGVYTAETYFAADGTNPVRINKDSRTASYPCYVLAAGGTVAEIASAEAPLPAGPEIDVDGLRTLTVDFNRMTWQWERITTPNCMPDDELLNYKTKEFVARDGSMKTWMVEFVRWDGGDIYPKLGSLMVPSATGSGTAGSGGYAAGSFPTSWNDPNMNPNYETTEVGGNLAGTSEHGRIYHFNEVVTGNPRFGIGYERYEALPDGWMEGKTIVDAIGRSFTVEHIVHTAAGTFTGDNAADEKAHPMLTMQVQGICPYGWHVANASDWLDLAYAASQASAGHTFPVNESRVTYKQFTTVSGSTPQVDEPNSPRGIGNFAPWLRNSGWGSNAYVSDGADEFGFNYYPIGFRYMTQGFQCAGTRCQTFVPLCYNNTKYPGTAIFRINVIINNKVTSAEMTNLDNGQAIFPFRCVKDYDAE